MQDDRGRRATLPRRRILKALVAAPAALAGCAAVTAEQQAADAPHGGGRPRGAPGAAASAAVDEALAAVRGFPLPPDAEPASVFRAAAARPGVPR